MLLSEFKMYLLLKGQIRQPVLQLRDDSCPVHAITPVSLAKLLHLLILMTDVVSLQSYGIVGYSTASMGKISPLITEMMDPYITDNQASGKVSYTYLQVLYERSLQNFILGMIV